MLCLVISITYVICRILTYTPLFFQLLVFVFDHRGIYFSRRIPKRVVFSARFLAPRWLKQKVHQSLRNKRIFKSRRTLLYVFMKLEWSSNLPSISFSMRKFLSILSTYSSTIISSIFSPKSWKAAWISLKSKFLPASIFLLVVFLWSALLFLGTLSEKKISKLKYKFVYWKYSIMLKQRTEIK